MSSHITEAELNGLPFIKLAAFSPDHDEEAKFVLVDVTGDKHAVTLICRNKQRRYVFGDRMPPQYRAAALEAIDILIDVFFADVSKFNQDTEDESVLFIAQHSMCGNFGLYSSEGRLISDYEEE